jgi:hypothetical protein
MFAGEIWRNISFLTCYIIIRAQLDQMLAVEFRSIFLHTLYSSDTVASKAHRRGGRSIFLRLKRCGLTAS